MAVANPHILAIDQGTTSSRAIIFDEALRPIAQAQAEFPQYFPQSGHVEHDGEEIWASVLSTCRQALAQSGLSANQIAAIGITNQRETTLIWDRKTGVPIHKAIVWQDRRTAPLCDALKAQGHEALVQSQTGLLLDPYFSATKIKWILEHVEGARAKAEAGELAFGTIDSFLIWKLTRGKHHVTDATNASRTMLYDIGKGEWSTELCRLFEIPMALLPSVQDCASHFGETHPEIFGSPISICAVAGDQQAATLGQACFKPGMLKATFGTGCFALLNTGSEKVQSKNRLLTTIAYQFDGKVTYALEGSIFIAGAVVQWLRDGLKIIHHAGETANLADAADASQNVIIVPAFTGLGAPYWNAHCRGAIFGLTRNSGPAEFARAALQSVGFQTRDLWQAMRVDWHVESQTTLRVDGGMSASDYTMQFLSDILNVPVDRPPILETTALGVAWAAGHRAGVLDGMEAFAKHWQVEKSFSPQMNDEAREAKYQSWKRAITSTLQF